MKDLIKYLSGLIILTLGISLIILSNIGASPWDSVSAGLANQSNITMGTWTTITGIFLVLLIALIVKKKPNYLAIIAGLITGLFINVWLLILSPFSISIMYGVVGIVCFALGISIYSTTNLPVNPIDNFMMTLVKEKKMNVSLAKVYTDGLGLFFALLIGGPIGLGTIVIYITVPPLIGLFSRYTKKI